MYGYIKDNKVICVGQDSQGKWQGNIYYNDDNSRKTTDEVLQMFSEQNNPLKEIVVPTDFDGNTTHYNYVEQNGKIVLAGLKSEVIKEREKQADMSRISTLKRELASEDYKVIKCIESQMNGLELPYNIVELTASRNAKREEINLLEQKWGL